MQAASQRRRSSTNPVRVSLFERDEKGIMKPDSKKVQTIKSKPSISSVDSSHIPRPRLRASSCDRASNRGSFFKASGKTPLHQYLSAAPITPVSNASKHSLLSVAGSSGRNAAGLPTGRRSLSADRASNIGGKSTRKDMRPLTDKTYQVQMLAKIDQYFSANQCSSMLNSNGSLKPINLKMFVEVSAYLVRVLNIKQVLTITNYVEEMPKIAKRLHYPGMMTKSWLKTANAMHSWPHVLGWVCWLVQVCEIRELAFAGADLNNLPFMGTEMQAKINKHAFLSKIDFYNAWNDERLDEEAALVDQYLQDIEIQQGITEDDLNIARSELENEMLKLEAVEANAQELDEEVKQLKEVLSSLQKDEAKQLSDIAAKEEYIRTTNLEVEHINAETSKLSEQLSLLNVEHDELITTIERQPMSIVERNKIVEKCAEIQNYMHQFDDYLQEIQKELYTMDIKLASINNNFNKSVLTYNKEMLVNFTDNISGITLEELKIPEKVSVLPEMMELLDTKSNLMNDMKKLLEKKLNEEEALIHACINEKEKLQEKIRVMEDECEDIAHKLRERKSHMKKVKKKAKEEEQKLKEHIRILQNDIKEMQESIPDTQKVLKDLEDAACKLDELRRKKAFIEESAKIFFNKLYEVLGHHRSEMYNILTGAQVVEKLNKNTSEKKT